MTMAPNDQEWRKSSYSSGNPTGSCVEVAWRKSSYSSGNPTGDCVEVAFKVGHIGVRDSKNIDGPTLAFPAGAWRVFTAER
jgi:hypothetical protein